MPADPGRTDADHTPPPNRPSAHPRRRLVPVLLVVAAVVATIAVVPLTSASAAGPNPIAVTPFSGFNALLTRAPYVTDLTQTSADVNWATTQSPVQTPGTLEWGPLGNCTAHVATVPPTLPNSYPAANTPASVNGSAFTVVTTEYQSTVVLSGLSAGTTYCYRPLGAGSVDLLGSNPSQKFTTLDPVGPSVPLTFDVIGDLGETLYSSTTAFANNLNTDQAAIDSLIGQSATTAGAKFIVTAGDVGYSNGSQSNYGDLQNGGSEISDIFGPSYWPQTGGLPVYSVDGNHGENTTGLHNWPESAIAQQSLGTYAYDSYPALPADGTTAAQYPDAWYAVSDGNVRIYVLNGAWADGNPGNTNIYQVDHDEHWTTSSPEYKWLAADLAAHPNTVKMAVWHFPIRSDNTSQASDTTLQNTPSNPNSLEALLATNGVQLVFNGHAHTYQRIAPTNYLQNGEVVNYVTGGGGGVLEPINGTCSSFTSTGSIYAIGWSPTKNSGSVCGAGVPVPQSAAQVYNYLQVSVNGNQVTVTPINAAGQSFDVQTYTYSGVTSTPSTVIDTSPPALTNSTTAAVTFHSTGSGATFTCKLDSGAATACTSPVTYSGLAPGSHSVTVTASGGATPAIATWTVDTTAPTVPSGVSASAVSSTQVNLSWTGSTDSTGVTGYDIYRNGTLLTTTSGTGTTYSDTSVTASKLYSYAIDARDGAGNVSAQSSPPATATTPSAPSGPTLVQTAGSSTTTVTLPAASTPGDLLVLSASNFTGASKPITAVSDGKNTWTKVMAKYVSGENSDGELWYAPNAASVQSVTVTTGATTVALQLQEFSGVATTSPLDTSVGAAGDTTSANSGTASPAASGELAVGFIAGHSSTQAISVTSPGFAVQPLVTTSSPSKASVESGYQDLTSSAAQSFAGSFGSTMYWAAGLAFFKAGTAPPPPGDFSLTASPSAGTAVVGSPATSTISTATVSGTAQTVGFTASGLPTGTTASFSPSSVTSGSSSTLTLTPSASTPAGTSTVTVTGTGTGTTHTTTFSLTVNTAPAVTSANSTTFTQGTAGTFTVTASGSPTPAITESGALPNGVTLTDNHNGTATLAGSPASGSNASYPITITATGAGTPANQSFTLNVLPQPSDFSFGLSPTAATDTAGAAATTSVNTAVTEGASQTVGLGATGVPTGSLVSFSPQSISSGGTSTLSITPPVNATPGLYTVTVTGTGTTMTHTATFALTVNTPATITSVNNATFTQGSAGTFTVTTSGSSPISLSEVGPLPTGVTFTDKGNGTATLAGSPATGSNSSYPITIGATNGFGTAASQSFVLTVNPAAAPPDFTIGSTPTSASVAAGSAATATITTGAVNGQQSVALSAVGAPSAALVSFAPSTITSGGNSTLQVTTAAGTTPGSYPITVTGIGNAAGTPTHSTVFTLTVTAAAVAPHLVQTASGTETTSSTSLAATFPTQTGGGDLLVLSASEYNGATNHITSVTDTAGNKWTLIGSYNSSGHNSNGEMWYAANTSPTLTVTIHNSAAAFETFEVQEFAGLSATPLDVATGTSNTGTAASSGSVSSTVAGELAVGLIAGHGNAEAISVTSAGYTSQAQQTSTGSITTVKTGYQVLGAPGSQSFAGSFGTAMYWAAGVAIFKPAG